MWQTQGVTLQNIMRTGGQQQITKYTRKRHIIMSDIERKSFWKPLKRVNRVNVWVPAMGASAISICWDRWPMIHCKGHGTYLATLRKLDVVISKTPSINLDDQRTYEPTNLHHQHRQKHEIWSWKIISHFTASLLFAIFMHLHSH